MQPPISILAEQPLCSATNNAQHVETGDNSGTRSMSKSRLLPLSLLVCVYYFGGAAATTPAVHEPASATENDTKKNSGEKEGVLGTEPTKRRVTVASGSSRSRRGWILGTELESSDLRAVFQVCSALSTIFPSLR